jgi:hypothetical protein
MKVLFYIAFGFIGLSFGLHLTALVLESKDTHQPTNQTIKVDSLENVIDSLQIHVETLEKQFDKSEQHFDYVMSDYNFGLEYLKNYHTKAYMDFHRVIGMRENFTREVEKENKERWKMK